MKQRSIPICFMYNFGNDPLISCLISLQRVVGVEKRTTMEYNPKGIFYKIHGETGTDKHKQTIPDTDQRRRICINSPQVMRVMTGRCGDY